MVRELDGQETRIVDQLVRDPRVSDNQISRNTGIPLKTVNTKRKKLEKEKLLRYYVELDNSRYGTGLFNAQHLYEVHLRTGITRQMFLQHMIPHMDNPVLRKHIHTSFFTEEDGHVVLYLVLTSYDERDILEIFNADVSPLFTQALGQDAVQRTRVSVVRTPLRIFHNYIPLDMEQGKLPPNKPTFVYGK